MFSDEICVLAEVVVVCVHVCVYTVCGSVPYQSSFSFICLPVSLSSFLSHLSQFLCCSLAPLFLSLPDVVEVKSVFMKGL